ncbi:MAG: DinB family protein [Acidimicrobiales bacterium]
MTEAAVDHQTPTLAGDSKETLVAFLGYLRRAVVRKLQGVTEDDARRSLVPSGTTLLGLVKHLAFVEVYWAQRRLAGLDIGPVADDGFTVEPGDTVASVIDAYIRAGQHTDEIVAGSHLDTPLALGRHGLTLRWILVHLVEETGRHAGHADILRELVDGAAGR